MKRSLLTTLFTFGLATSALADVTVKQTTSGKGMGLSAGATATTYIKGMKMRTESVMGDVTRTQIFDVEAQKMYSFDSKRKEVEVFDMQAMAAEMSKAVQVGDMKAAVKPNGQTKQVLDKTAAGYDMTISVPAMIGGEKGMKMDIMLTGPMWIVKGAPGTDDYSRFYKGAVEKGFIFTDPRAAKGSPGQAKAMAEMYRQMADIGGVPYETEMNIKVGGEGPMAGLMAKMGGMSMTTAVQSIETGTLADDMFAPPAGYKVTVKK